jgi:signal transduction histidine kinase
VISVLRDEDSAAEGPQPVLGDVPRLIGESRDVGMEVRLRDEVVDPEELPDTAGRTVYRVVQEGLTNARKHAAGTPVQVLLEGRPGEHLGIEIRNRLTEVPATAPGAGIGLIGLAERARLAGGRLEHEVAGGEFRLRAWLPWRA